MMYFYNERIDTGSFLYKELKHKLSEKQKNTSLFLFTKNQHIYLFYITS